MKFVYRGIITALIAITVAAAGARADTLTLDQAIETALKIRASIISARGSEELARAGKQAALGAFLPQLSADYNYNKRKVLSPDTLKGTTSSRSATLSGNMSLIDLGNVFSYSAARASVEAARLDVINSEQDLIYSVKTAYFAYLAALQNVNVEQEAVKRSEEQLKLIQSRFELGSAAKSDVLKQQVQYGNDQLALLQARNAVVTTLATLDYTVGIDPRRNTDFSPNFTTREYTGSLDEAMAYGMQHEPSILRSQADVRAANSNVKAAYTGYLPNLSGSGSYGWSKSGGGVGTFKVPGITTLTYGVRASWNIFDGFLREQRITSAKVTRNNAEAGLADARNLVASQIKSAYLEIEQYKEQKQVSQENVDAATEDLKITQEKYNLGAATILDLLNAQVSLAQAQVAFIQADFNMNLAVANLERAMGKV